jgi:26S proteasome subunit RPN7
VQEKAIEAEQLALEKTAGLGSRIDIVLTLVRIGFFFGDNQLISTNLTKADEFVEKGGDWDRRNRLKVYRGLHLLSIRQFKPASALLIDALSTFTATELLSYNDFVSLTVIAGALTLKRVDLKKKVRILIIPTWQDKADLSPTRLLARQKSLAPYQSFRRLQTLQRIFMTVTTTSFLLHLVGHIVIGSIVYRPDNHISFQLRLSKPTFCPHASLHRTPVSTFVRCAYSPMHNYCSPILHSRWTLSPVPLGSQLTSLIGTSIYRTISFDS